MKGLTKGAAYHVRVSAYNGVALSYGKTMPSTPPVIRPGETPEPPSRIEVDAASPSSLAISWSPPNDAMGAEIISYQVVREQHKTAHDMLSSRVSSDTPSLFFRIERMWACKPVNVVRYHSVVAFSPILIPMAIFIAISRFPLVPYVLHAWRHSQEWDGAPGVSEQQLIRIFDAVSGTFRLTLDGATTASIPHNALASKVASALAALPNVAEPVEVRVVLVLL